MSELTMSSSTSGRVRSADPYRNARLVVAYAEVLGLVAPAQGPDSGTGRFDEAVRALGELGVARQLRPVAGRTGERDLANAAAEALDAIEGSPLPAAEWTALDEVLGNMLPGLVGVSMSSVSRYRAGTRTTPDAVAARLHVLALIVTDLAGSYNEFGIRRWFQRPRSALDGRAPREILSGGWQTAAADTVRVRELAASLTGPGAW